MLFSFLFFRFIKKLFASACEKKPSIIFIDEVDALCGDHRGGDKETSRMIKAELLVEIQGLGKDY